jgi:hypothetical protein
MYSLPSSHRYHTHDEGATSRNMGSGSGEAEKATTPAWNKGKLARSFPSTRFGEYAKALAR